jgi:hypothetical protein
MIVPKGEIGASGNYFGSMKADLLHHRPERLTDREALAVQLQGSNSLSRRLGQLLAQ